MLSTLAACHAVRLFSLCRNQAAVHLTEQSGMTSLMTHQGRFCLRRWAERQRAAVSKRGMLVVAVAGFMAAMWGWLLVESVWRPVLQGINEVVVLKESKKLKLAQRYFLHDYKDADNSDPNKPCRSNQLCR